MKLWVQIILLLIFCGILESAAEGLGTMILVITGIGYYVKKKKDGKRKNKNT